MDWHSMQGGVEIPVANLGLEGPGEVGGGGGLGTPLFWVKN